MTQQRPSPSTAAVAEALPPHAPLTAYYGNEVEHQQFLRRIFDETAPDYDRIERVLAFGTGSWYRRSALRRAGLWRGARVLDVGIGTGLLAREALRLIGPDGVLVGIDPSAGMMRQADLPGVELLLGCAEALPRPDASCDVVTMGYALRHIADLNKAFQEFHRVLRPGGRVLVLEITRPDGRLGAGLLRMYMRGLIPWVAGLVSRRRDTSELWRYYWDTIEGCIPPRNVLAVLRAAGFDTVQRHVELGIFSEYTAIKPA